MVEELTENKFQGIFILDFNLVWYPEYIKNSLPNNKNQFKKQAKDLKIFFKENIHMANKLMKIFS